MIGVLSGGLASCGDSIGYNPDTDRVIFSLRGNENDYFTKLYFAWDHYAATNKQLKHWLDPIGTGQLVIGGLTSMAVGTKEQITAGGVLHVYPNPASGNFTIELPEYTGKQVGIELYDMTGRRVHAGYHASVFPLTVSAGDLPAGIYLLRVKGENLDLSGRVMLER
jgi:hypothetical protein